MSRLPRSLSTESIRQAWKLSRDSKLSKAGAPGIDGISSAVFASQLLDRIEEMRMAIRSGSYRFSSLRMAPVPKETEGEFRIIAIPTVKDRLLQRALLAHLEEAKSFPTPSKVAFGFTRGRSLADAHRCALEMRGENPWVLKVDVIKFFDEIDREHLKSLISRKVRARAVEGLLVAAVDCELDEGGGRGPEIARLNGIQRGRGLRQGMPISPMLSNLLLREFDTALSRRHLRAIRYADDIAIFSASRSACQDAFAFIREQLSALKLRVPDLEIGKKASISEPSSPVEFLGLDIKKTEKGYKLSAPFRKIEKIENEMAKIASLQECVGRRRTFAQVERALESFIVGHTAAMVEIEDSRQFTDRLRALKRKRLEMLLDDLIGPAAVKRLDHERRAILGLDPFEPSRRRS